MSTRSNPFAPGARYVPPQDTFVPLSSRPDVRFLSQAVQPPSQVYVESTDVLRIVAASSQANEALTVSWRLLLPSGDIVLNQTSVAVPATRVLTIHDEPMAEGFLLSVSCRAATATTRGQTFARIFLTDPDLGAGQPSYMLMADYVTTSMAPSHPNGRVLAPNEGPGWSHEVDPGAFGAGFDWVVQVPTNAIWEPLSVHAKLTTGVAAANRYVHIIESENLVGVFDSIAVNPQGAGIARIYCAGPGVPNAFDADFFTNVGLPIGLLLHGSTSAQVSTITTNLQAADQWTSMSVEVEEWLDNV